LIDRAFFLGDQRVDDIYVPRLDVVAVPDTASVRDALDIAIESGHRRIPTYEDNIDNIVGVVRLSDLAREAIDHPDKPVSLLAHEPLVVPESKRVIDLLAEMQKSGIHFAVAVDEYGGTAGIATIEDVAARLVGPIAHEGEKRAIGLERVDATTWIAAGTTDVDELERELELPLPEGDWNTVAGLLIGLAGRIPEVGESFTAGQATLVVVATAANRITRVRVTCHRTGVG
jgi:CBS domain containing-hemolysin-like protein